MFVVKTSVWLNAIETFRDGIAKAINNAWAGHSTDGYFVRTNKALPTRDAILPMLALLGLAEETKKPISKLTESLPKRYTASDRIQDMPINKSQRLIASLIDNPEAIIDMLLPNATNVLTIDLTDGLRVEFDTGNIVHLRPSGNVTELRCYAKSNDYKKTSKNICFCFKTISNFLNEVYEQISNHWRRRFHRFNCHSSFD